MNVLLTLDYELYNGLIGGTVANCLIKPMEELEKIIDKHDFKITIFADACFLLTLKRLKANQAELEEDWIAISTQLKRFADKGHSVQLHLHPQWINAKFENGVWYSELNSYKLADLNERDAHKLFVEGCQLIKDITGHAPKAFRAGDYCAQTFGALAKAFSTVGIVIDSSVLRHKRAINKYEWFDYTKIPSSYIYKFTNCVTEMVPNGKYTEISIPTYKHNILELFFRRKKIRKMENSTWGDGKSSTGGQLDKGLKKYYNRINFILKPALMSASIDGISATYLRDIYKYEKKRKSSYMMIMGHPKTFTPYYLSLFDSFVSALDKDDCLITIEKMIRV